MATLKEIALALTSVCTAVPPVGDGVCACCHGCPGPGYATCYNCYEVKSQLSHPCDLVVPISLYEIPSQLHHMLRNYKSDTSPAARRDAFSIQVLSLLAYFLVNHRGCIVASAGGKWDAIATVPSSRPRRGEHPLVTAIRLLPWLGGQYHDVLKLGSEPVRHNSASDLGFEVTADVAGTGYLLIDDTFTTGATAQSAASALNLAGADVKAIVTVGRVINPKFNATVGQYWDRQHTPDALFTFERCCLE